MSGKKKKQHQTLKCYCGKRATVKDNGDTNVLVCAKGKCNFRLFVAKR